jgi:hypothetical protein
MRARLLILSLLLVACKKEGGAGGSTEAKRSALDKLPANTAIVFGMNRGVSEKEMYEAIQPVVNIITTGIEAQSKGKGAEAFQCAFRALAKLRYVVVGLGVGESLKEPPELVILAKGDKLRPAVEECGKMMGEADGKKLEVGAQGALTKYSTGDKDPVYVAWLDDDTLLAGPFTSAEKTEALVKAQNGLTSNAAMAGLLDKADTAAGMWGVADTTKFAKEMRMPPGVPAPKAAWFELTTNDGLSGKVSLQLDSKDAAQALKTKVEQMLPLLGSAIPPQAKGVLDSLKLSTEGDVLTAMAKLDSAMGMLPMGGNTKAMAGPAMVGVMAAVAIPAFMKYKSKAKTTEAVINVRKLYDGARSYYEENHQFPPNPTTAGPVPALGGCCSTGGKCAPNPTLWSDAAWQALRFSMDDPHYYSYEYKTSGEGANATFSVDAYGDLNCNGVYSTFEMVGSIQPDGTVTGEAGLFRDKELE